MTLERTIFHFHFILFFLHLGIGRSLSIFRVAFNCHGMPTVSLRNFFFLLYFPVFSRFLPCGFVFSSISRPFAACLKPPIRANLFNGVVNCKKRIVVHFLISGLISIFVCCRKVENVNCFKFQISQNLKRFA